MDEPPFCQPSVATSNLTASKIPASRTYGELPAIYTAIRHSRKATPTRIPLPEASTATTYTTAMVPPHGPLNDENLPPAQALGSLQHKHKNSIDIAAAKLRGKSKLRPLAPLPKSSTLNVLSNLTASISRTSLSKFSRSTSISSTAESEPRTSIASSSSVRLPGVNASNPLQISTAQPSAYWTGRFMALQDRFRNEMLLPENMTTLITAHAERSIVPDCASKPSSSHVPASSSNPSLVRSKARKPKHSSSNVANNAKLRSRLAQESLDAARLEDEDNRARRVFLHLEAMCTTSEAKRSLHAWQQSYARRMGREELLPRGGTMDDKGWVGRFLGRNSHDESKRSSVSTVF
ncbi:hypothetical protein JX265_001124 [Neoarthrinium moseri]|uniref:Uncharacterized protein n=1 Tax=Neoarthrinium moseri TaxID=1658444 RepID=A0A9Q0AW57_9PEZI|nr:hypothetical protein JX265_001124 [Neoarthrinium moseri]